MGILSWLRKLQSHEDEEAIERAEERSHETAEERKFTSGDIVGLEDDQFVARSEHEANIEDVDRLGEQ